MKFGDAGLVTGDRMPRFSVITAKSRGIFVDQVSVFYVCRVSMLKESCFNHYYCPAITNIVLNDNVKDEHATVMLKSSLRHNNRIRQGLMQRQQHYKIGESEE